MVALAWSFDITVVHSTGVPLQMYVHTIGQAKVRSEVGPFCLACKFQKARHRYCLSYNLNVGINGGITFIFVF